MVVLVAGTFLPWVRSGRVSRNSYELAGVGVRRLDAGPWIEGALQAWPFLGPLWAVVVVLMVLRRRRSAAVASLVLAVPTGLVALCGVVLAVRFDAPTIGGVWPGPAVTLVGAVGCAVAGVALLRRPTATETGAGSPVAPPGPPRPR